MILAARLDISGGLDLLEVDRRPHHRQAVRDDHAIVAIEVDQILPVPLRGQVGRIAVPIEEVEGRIIVAEQIIADDIIPDKVAPAQAVEGRGYIAPVEEAARRQLLERSEEHQSELQALMR